MGAEDEGAQYVHVVLLPGELYWASPRKDGVGFVGEVVEGGDAAHVRQVHNRNILGAFAKHLGVDGCYQLCSS